MKWYRIILNNTDMKSGKDKLLQKKVRLLFERYDSPSGLRLFKGNTPDVDQAVFYISANTGHYLSNNIFLSDFNPVPDSQPEDELIEIRSGINADL